MGDKIKIDYEYLRNRAKNKSEHVYTSTILIIDIRKHALQISDIQGKKKENEYFYTGN